MELYRLTEGYKVLTTLQEKEEGEADLTAILDAIEEQFEQKAENVAKAVRILEAEADVFAAEGNRMIGEAHARLARATALKQYLQQNMEMLGKEDIKGQILSLKLQLSPPSCGILDEEQVPWAYKEIVTMTKVDKRAIIEAWKREPTMEIPGAVIQQSKHLRIRP